jgi:hypothetical protein
MCTLVVRTFVKALFLCSADVNRNVECAPMAGALLLPLLLALGAPPTVQPTQTLAWVSTSTQNPALNQRIFEGVRVAFVGRTSLDAKTGEQAGLDEYRFRRCSGSFVCWLDELELVEPRPSHLLVTSTTKIGDGQHRVLIALMDAELAIRARDAALSRDPGNSEAAEALIFQDAVRSVFEVARVSTQTQVNRLMKDFVDRQKGRLVQAGVWVESGTLQLEFPEVGEVAIDLGGQRFDALQLRLTIPHVLPGLHRVRLVSPTQQFAELEQMVTVQTGTVAVLSFETPDFGEGARAVRQSSRWAGVAVFVAGSALLAHSLRQRRDGGPTFTVCPNQCDPSRFRELGPVLEAPLGYSLMATGATWTAGSYWEGAPYEAPIWSILAGVVIGGLSYGLSAALD